MDYVRACGACVKREPSQEESAPGGALSQTADPARLGRAGVVVEDVAEVVRPVPNRRIWVRIPGEQQRPELRGRVSAEGVGRAFEMRAAELPHAAAVPTLVRYPGREDRVEVRSRRWVDAVRAG